MDFLKEVFGEEALTFEQLAEKLKDNKDIKLGNLAGGEYVAKKKHDDALEELATAKNTITGLKETVAKFDGVDVEALKTKATQLEEKYNNDIASLKLDSALTVALLEAKVKNPKLAKAALDTSIIKLDGDKITGLSEQITALKESDGYLFEEETTNPGNNTPTVTTGGNHNNNNSNSSFMTALMNAAGLGEQSKGD